MSSTPPTVGFEASRPPPRPIAGARGLTTSVARTRPTSWLPTGSGTPMPMTTTGVSRASTTPTCCPPCVPPASSSTSPVATHRGDRPVVARVSADEPDGAGLTRLAVEVDDREVTAIDIPCTTTAFDVVCPTTAAGDLSVDLAALPEGRHVMRPAASEHRASGDPWSVTIDRTPPPAPENLRLEHFHAAASAVATFGWDVAADPALSGGVPGSGIARSEVRYSVNGSDFGPWAASDEDSVDVAGLQLGDTVGLQARASTRSATSPPWRAPRMRSSSATRIRR